MAVSNTSATLSASCESYMFGSFSCGPGVCKIWQKKKHQLKILGNSALQIGLLTYSA